MNVNIKFDSLVFLLISAFASYAYTAEPIVLKNEVGQLSVLPDGSMQLTSDNTQCPVWKLESSRLWEITLAKGTNPFHLSENATVFVSGKNVPIVSQEADGVKLNYTSISNGKQTWDIGLTLTVKHVDNEFQFIAVVDNQTEDWTVKSFKFPILFDIRLEGSDHQNLSVLWPNGLGQRMKTPAKFGKSQVADYPSKGASMQWCEVVAKEAGLYLGCHDNKKSYKKFEMVNQKDHYEFSLTQSPYCLPGKIWQSPPFVVMPFEGTWYVGAHRYRKWMDTWLHWAVTPDWIKTANSGWFLCILKQQNGDLMFRYDELDTVADIADEWGLDVLGLFGWAHGGHDREYPHYDPDPEMGGPEALKKAIKRVQKRGKKVILYANGQLIDSASDFYREKGVQSMLQQPDQKPSIQMYNKFKATSTPIFVQACLGSETWYQQLLQLGFQAQDLGADGIIYDQLGVGGPTACYNENHGHKTPTMAWAECRFRTIERLTKEFQKRDPDFIVMTEGLIDAEMADLPYFHGYSFGIFPFLPTPHQQAFPEMFRYTFPELVVTQRNSKPMADRDIVNFSTFSAFAMRSNPDMWRM